MSELAGHVAQRFVATVMCAPGQPMLVLVDEAELEQHRDRRVTA